MKRKLGSRLYVALFLLFMYLPILVLVAFSFNASRSRSHWTGFTFAWYNKLFHNQEIWSAILNTLFVATIAPIVATVLGTISAVGVHFLGKRFKRIMITLTNLPIINPEIITGVSLMLMFKFLRIEAGFKTLILAHVSFNVPYVIFNVLPKLKQMDKHLCDVAMDLGCNWVQVFFKVILPEILPGVMAGFLMAVAFSLDDFVVSYFTSGPTSQALPLTIFAMTRRKVSPEINAFSSIMFVLVLSIIFVMQRLELRSKQVVRGRKTG